MIDLTTYILSLIAGGLLGTIFFGGLWWTIRKSVSSPRPALWFIGSIQLRMFIAVTGFYLVGHGDWHRLLVCLMGFLAARVVITQLTRGLMKEKLALAKGAGL